METEVDRRLCGAPDFLYLTPMANPLRRWFHRFVPSHFHDPLGLAARLLRTGDPAAMFAMQTAVLGVVATPLDLLLRTAERRLYRNAPPPRLPLLFVCGAPRTGTTLVYQVLIEQLPFAFINNLTTVFPRAPLTANRVFRVGRQRRQAPYHNYYGKTVGLSGPNDGLHLWDRWLGTDRTRIPASLSPGARRDMRQFFGVMEQLFGRPLLAKNNSLNGCASLIAEVFERSFFICMTRDPLYLAQAQLRARIDIHGAPDIPYGPSAECAGTVRSSDLFEDVCRHVLYHQHLGRSQQQKVGAERFWLVSYEEFCREPGRLVSAVAENVLGGPLDADAPILAPFDASNRVRIDPGQFRQLAATLDRLARPLEDQRQGTTSCPPLG